MCPKCEENLKFLKQFQEDARFFFDKWMEDSAEYSRLKQQNLPLGNIEYWIEFAADALESSRALVRRTLRELEDCNKKCYQPPPPAPPAADPTGTGGGSGTDACACGLLESELEAWESLRAEIVQHFKAVNALFDEDAARHQRNKSRLESLRTAGAGDSAEARSLADQVESYEAMQRMGITDGARKQVKEDEAARLAEHDAATELRRKRLEDCRKRCGVKQTSAIFRSPIPYAAAGSGVLVALLAGGGDTPVVSTPALNQRPQQPQAQQPPPPQPPQPPAETIAGTADCTACAPTVDPGRLNATINLCPQLTGAFELAVASLTIRHRPPFVDLVGAQYDPASGAFRGTARGTVAGIPNVGIAAEGTANAQTGSVVFDYTMGTGGELPGGRAISYRITLQKRR